MPQDAGILHTLLNAPELMVWMTDERHLCVYVNPAVLNYSGKRADEMMGLDWMSIVHPDDLESVQRNHAAARERPHNFRQEYRVVTPDGEVRWALDLCIARFDRRKKFLGYIGVVTDITEQKREELQLRAQRRELEAQLLEISDREQRRLGQDLHDGLSQRLLALALKGDALQEDLARKNPKAAAAAGRIVAEVNRAIRETREISRSLAPIALGKNRLGPALQELFHYVRRQFRVAIRTRGLPRDFGLDLDASVHLYRIVQEALTNAVRHGRAKRIEISARKEKNGSLTLKVRDRGKGLPRRIGGSGMGLATMRYRAELLGGALDLRPAAGGGAELCLALPARTKRNPR